MRSIWGTLTYGHRLQIAESSFALPLDRSDLDTWVTRSEDRNTELSKRKKGTTNPISPVGRKGGDEMSAKETTATATPNGECHGQYFNIKPRVSPQSTSVHWFNSCCCDDGVGALVDALVAFILARKAANPQIFAARKLLSPNGACQAVEIQWDFGSGAPSTQSKTDLVDILLYYIALLASL